MTKFVVFWKHGKKIKNAPFLTLEGVTKDTYFMIFSSGQENSWQRDWISKKKTTKNPDDFVKKPNKEDGNSDKGDTNLYGGYAQKEKKPD